MISKERANYIAGLMDGEGSIMLIRQGKNKTKSPTIQITTTTPEILEGLLTEFGGTYHYRDNEHILDWQLKSADKAIYFLNEVLPYMKLKKKISRGQFILKYYKKVTPRNGRYNENTLLLKKQFENNFALLTGIKENDEKLQLNI